MVQEVRDVIEADGETVIVDLHVWRVGPGKYACIVGLVTANPEPPEHYKDRLRVHEELDLAGGRGRHALWLARRGWRVCVVDISDVALGKLGETAARLKLNVRLVAGDVTDFAFEPNRYDLILLFYHFDRRLFPEMAPALRTDGLVICKLAISWDRVAVSANPTDRPLDRDELPTLLPELQAPRPGGG